MKQVNIFQRTLKNVIRATGVGVHTGEKVCLTLLPAPVDTGIIFRRMDFESPVEIAANSDNVVATAMSTTLASENASVSTVEHLLSALSGLGIDNVYVEVDKPEVPIMDGSAGPFVFLIQSAGIKEQSKPKRFIKVKRAIKIQDGDKWASIEPYNGFKMDFQIDYTHPFIKNGQQIGSMEVTSASYIKEVSRARTFGFLSDAEKMRQLNLALGTSMDNTVVLDEFRILNDDGLRYSDEFVKHKMLDAIGDLFVLGANVLGHVKYYKSGHALNNALNQELMSQQDAWEWVTFENESVDSLPSTYMIDDGDLAYSY